jgi:hypothetical protein
MPVPAARSGCAAEVVPCWRSAAVSGSLRWRAARRANGMWPSLVQGAGLGDRRSAVRIRASRRRASGQRFGRFGGRAGIGYVQREGRRRSTGPASPIHDLAYPPLEVAEGDIRQCRIGLVLLRSLAFLGHAVSQRGGAVCRSEPASLQRARWLRTRRRMRSVSSSVPRGSTVTTRRRTALGAGRSPTACRAHRQGIPATESSRASRAADSRHPAPRHPSVPGQDAPAGIGWVGRRTTWLTRGWPGKTHLPVPIPQSERGAPRPLPTASRPRRRPSPVACVAS